MILKSSFET